MKSILIIEPNDICNIDPFAEYEYIRTNREQRLRPKTGRFWCGTCDRYRVGHYQRCPVCGTKSGIRRYKKE